ncbi:hypothetical protein CONLIGDRAFT_684732 [Coniochaeta ligniaria NRRL 30616]|uniref:Uncharacterized protein n=1 Tax=Coniochaeta ligniaria NRRL 30616 TaxID=1408157 RepID=A0A1J7JB73_9PEZI|nr:hypothetical protein CONLIGDRAFT_684732 [Coniochaeta ligniaria NRRL 30616]
MVRRLEAVIEANEELVGRHAHDPACTANVTLYDTTTVVVATTTTVDVTHVLDVYVNSTTTNTVAAYVTEYTTNTLHFTEYTTTTLHYTVNITETETDYTTLTNSTTVTTTGTASTTVTTTGVTGVTVTTTGTASTTVTTTGTTDTTVTTTGVTGVTVTTTGTTDTTITTTGTTGVTVTTTGTTDTTITTSTTTTTTLFSTTYEPCPKSCSISAETVNLYYWPTNRPYSYPTTYVDASLGYTFTSPSVYMYIPSARGINTLGQPAGPSTSQWILPLDLYEVSTIANGTGSTSQLNLADLGTNCPRTADPTAIITMVDAACDPVLAAPKQVSSWAYPCNACGRFGLFDPPYAVPTLTGSLIEPTTVVVPSLITITAAPTPTPTSAPPVGVLLVVYYSDGKPVATATIVSTGISGTVVSTVNVPAAPTSSTTPEIVSTTAPAATTSSALPETTAETSAAPSSASTSPLTSASTSSLSTSSITSQSTSASTTSPAVISSTSSSPSVVATAGAAKATCGLEWLLSSIVIAIFLL